MTSFLFMLTPEIEESLAPHVLNALALQFPECEFTSDKAENDNAVDEVFLFALVPNISELHDIQQFFARVVLQAKGRKLS